MNRGSRWRPTTRQLSQSCDSNGLGSAGANRAAYGVFVLRQAACRRHAPLQTLSLHLCKAFQKDRVRGGRLARVFGKASMPRKPQVAVEPRPDGRWAVQTDGTSRADSLHNRQSDAIERGRELAKSKETELVIKGEDGRIRKKDSGGNDPRGRG
jgi:hypothetical protein